MGVRLRDPNSLEESCAYEFCDGTILCQVVQAVEHMWGGMQGYNAHPHVSAQSLHNIRLALDVLQLKQNMPVQHLWSHAAIHAGETAVIVPLLRQIAHAYGHVLG